MIAKKKKIIIIAVFVVLVLVLAGGGYWVYKIRIQKAQDLKILDEFGKCQRGELDLQSIRYDQQDVFYIAARALIEKDRSICLKINGDETGQKVCQQYFDRFSIIARPDASENDCQGLSDSNDQIMCRAILQNDASICAGTKWPLFRVLCEANASLDAKYCDNISEPMESKGTCRKLMSNEQTKETGCGIVSAEKAKSLCYDSLYFITAIKKKDLSFCDKISWEKGNFNILLCRILLSQDPEKEYKNYYSEQACYPFYAASVAKIKKDASFCENIPQKASNNKDIYESCINQFK